MVGECKTLDLETPSRDQQVESSSIRCCLNRRQHPAGVIFHFWLFFCLPVEAQVKGEEGGKPKVDLTFLVEAVGRAWRAEDLHSKQHSLTGEKRRVSIRAPSSGCSRVRQYHDACKQIDRAGFS